MTYCFAPKRLVGVGAIIIQYFYFILHAAYVSDGRTALRLIACRVLRRCMHIRRTGWGYCPRWWWRLWTRRWCLRIGSYWLSPVYAKKPTSMPSQWTVWSFGRFIFLLRAISIAWLNESTQTVSLERIRRWLSMTMISKSYSPRVFFRLRVVFEFSMRVQLVVRKPNLAMMLSFVVGVGLPLYYTTSGCFFACSLFFDVGMFDYHSACLL